MQEIKKEIMHQKCFITTLSLSFNQLANGVIFPAEFKKRFIRVLRKSEGCWKKQKGTEKKVLYSAILFRNVTDHHLIIIKCAVS